jgi:hypothetical protein
MHKRGGHDWDFESGQEKTQQGDFTCLEVLKGPPWGRWIQFILRAPEGRTGFSRGKL